MVLGQVIQNLNLDINIKDNQSGLIDKLISQDKSRLDYRHEFVMYSNQNNNLIIRELKVPEYYLDKPLKLQFKAANQFALSYKDQVVFDGQLNKKNILNTNRGLWQIQLNAQGNLQNKAIL